MRFAAAGAEAGAEVAPVDGSCQNGRSLGGLAFASGDFLSVDEQPASVTVNARIAMRPTTRTAWPSLRKQHRGPAQVSAPHPCRVGTVALRKTGGELERLAHQAPDLAAESAFRAGFSGGLQDYSRQSPAGQEIVTLPSPCSLAYPITCAQRAESRDE